MKNILWTELGTLHSCRRPPVVLEHTLQIRADNCNLLLSICKAWIGIYLEGRASRMCWQINAGYEGKTDIKGTHTIHMVPALLLTV